MAYFIFARDGAGLLILKRPIPHCRTCPEEATASAIVAYNLC